MNIPMFNEAALTASVIAQGKDKIAELIKNHLINSLPKVHPERQEYFKSAMGVFATTGEQVVAAGDPEAVVQFVEKLRNYKPLLTLEDYENFITKSKKFMERLRDIGESVSSANSAKYRSISAKYLVEATSFRLAIAMSRRLYDIDMLDDLIVSWNQVAEEWKKAIDEAIPLN